MNRKGQFSIISALLVSIILVSTVIITYSTIFNNSIQVQPQVLTAIDETNFAIKQLLGFSVGYYGSVIQVTGDNSYANQSTWNYTTSGLQYIANTHANWGAGFSLTNLTIHTYWFNSISYSTGYLDVTYNLTELGIYGMKYAPSCGLTVQTAITTGTNQTTLIVTQDQNTPVTDLQEQNFEFFNYIYSNSTYQLIPPSTSPVVYANGTYLIQLPTGINVSSYVVQVQDLRGIIVVASQYSSYKIDLTWPSSARALAYFPITFANNQTLATPNPFQEKITWNPSSYSRYEASDLGNIRFYNDSGLTTPLYAWLESCTPSLSNTATNATAWIKLTSSIAASGGTETIYMAFLSTSTDFDGNYWGDAPNLSPTYGQYDNGGKIFSFYDNFAGNTISNAWNTAGAGGTYSVNNGLTMYSGAFPNYVFTLNNQYPGPLIIDAYQVGTTGNWIGASFSNLNTTDASFTLTSGAIQWVYPPQGQANPYTGLCIASNSTVFTPNPPSTTLQVVTLAVNSTTATEYQNYASPVTVSGTISLANYPGLVQVAWNPSSDTQTTYWFRLRAYPPNNIMPSTSFGSVTFLNATCAPDTLTIELLQNGTMLWLGQSLTLTTQSFPIPPLPVKSIHLNQTINGVNSEVPFQIEDWSTDYMIPLGMTSNMSIFGNGNMIVFLANSNVSTVTIWWNGSESATQTSYAFVDRYFTADNPTPGSTGSLTNNMGLKLQFNANFQPVSSIGSVSCTASFMRINNYASIYGGSLAYIIANGVVRDIVQQEAEWSNGIPSCPNIYSQIVLTLPANATYYTYQLRLIFVQSTTQAPNRNITDICPIELTSSITSTQTENGTSSAGPIVSAGTGLFFNQPAIWAHHWSEFISGTSGAGIMFTDSANSQLYAFDALATNESGTTTGCLRANSNQGTIELLPAEIAPVNFTTALDITWYGAVSTFNTVPIYQITNGVPNGSWIDVEYPPTAAVYAGS